MAQKRMFDKTITNSDDFLELPDSSQVLYFHLSMNADDDGFVNNWKSIMKMTGTKEDDLKLLIAKQYVIIFDSGIIVIRHWRINNYLRQDRYKETSFTEEKEQLLIGKNEEYILNNTVGIPVVYPDKNRIDKNSIVYNNMCNFEEEFEEIWKLYPNKKGKSESLKKYIKARKKGVEKETILNGLNNYIKEIKNKKIETKYIKNGSTWFNQECWNDEYDIKSKSDLAIEEITKKYMEGNN